MKKITLILSFLFVAFSMNAQFTVEDTNGTTITEGQTVTFGEVGYPEGNFDFFVLNPSTTDPIRMKIEFVSAVNADGSQMELCFGLCYTGITLGNIYPPNNEFVEIAPSSQTGPGNHMLNLDPGNGTDIIDYTFKFYEVDTDGTTQIGTPLTMVYRYDPEFLGVNDNSLDVTVNSTLVRDNMQVTTKEALDLVVYDLQGRIITSYSLNAGNQQVDLSSLSSQLYILEFSNNEGATFTSKIIKR